ncbi:hypothetical protein [Streptomyces lydicus]|uniref:hypothetical protein n=1 Tax=Streptomyces lydicus TaxID=47763 RepID=UPI0036EC4421
MSNPVLALVLLAVLVVTLAGVCCLAIVSHRRIAEQAMNRAGRRMSRACWRPVAGPSQICSIR